MFGQVDDAQAEADLLHVLQQGISRNPGSAPSVPAIGLDVDQVLERWLLGEGVSNAPGTESARWVAQAFSQQQVLENLVHIQAYGRESRNTSRATGDALLQHIATAFPHTETPRGWGGAVLGLGSHVAEVHRDVCVEQTVLGEVYAVDKAGGRGRDRAAVFVLFAVPR